MVDVAIVGGGVGGLTAALSLQHAGVKVAVYERAPELLELGAGLIVSKPAMRALNFLGVGANVRALAGKYPETGYHVMKHYATGEVIAPAIAHGSGPDRPCAMHRADLQSVLVDGVRANDPECLHLGHEFASLEQDGRGPIRLSFSNGEIVSADVVIGADGCASAVRSNVFGEEAVDFTGKVSYRGLIPRKLMTPELETMNGVYYLGPERMFLTYSVRGTDFLNVVAHSRQLGWAEEGWSIPATNAELLELYSDFCAPVHRVIEAIPPESLFKWALRDRSPSPRWVNGRVALLGDAAHPMLPFLGQGGNQAIEDGTVLGRCFETTGDIDDALARYEKVRKDRGNGVQTMTRATAEAQMRFENLEEVVFSKSAEAIYEYDPATVTV
ncbi:FAD-dependent monooxygenase [Mycobacterium sp. CVI_P3]|uniref:FAD-dependent monooxygenase n=1 Tax=Mycobacterium pinniadriaticum TaxID=2994102 RepID=A0ABT3SL79_9MYCO|nr:FAD-dependent monooxygenase [Mycobacterium pinniadriaticum]MCX2933771.1 FAD-dependent monooxygenase [Mycobacterium pinniadriaticum]MCX2940193.1 FAD-dependent monooxygenase [Mycobacterium pinniadriaticum]